MERQVETMKGTTATLGTRDRLIEASIVLLRQSGLAGAGINEIVRASGAPKGSVYHFFPDGKQQIAAEALAQYTQRVVAFIDAAMSRKRTPAAKVLALFEAFAQRLEQGDFRSSCAAGTVCLDLDGGLERLRPVVAQALAQYRDAIAAGLALRSDRRARSLAGLLLTAIEGAYIRGRADRSGAPFREAGAWLAELARREATRPRKAASRQRAR
jgi:TetR/AcrR family transcriptional repressor of lmrAB and yxaGH operons